MWEDPTQFPDITPRIIEGKDNQHFACRICTSGSLKLSNKGSQVKQVKLRNKILSMKEHLVYG